MTKLRNIPFSPPDITEEEIEEVVDTLRSGWITTGPKTKLFEKELSKYCNTSKTACLNSATAAMEMTLRLLGVGPGDEVITSAYTYTASASVIHHVGAKIVLIDTAKDSYEMDYDALEKAITTKTKVIIPVDIGGVMCDYDKIFEIINKKKKLFKSNNKLQKSFNRIVVMADAAHSIGATYKGKMSGEVADFTSFSFHAVKNLTTGEGGAVTWKDISGFDNEVIYKEFMNLSLHGQNKDALEKSQVGSWEYNIVAPNYKCNMTDIMASIGLVQLRRYNDILNKRKYQAELYFNKLSNLDIEFLVHKNKIQESSAHLLMIRLNNKSVKYRNDLIVELAKKGITTNVHYKPLPMHTAYIDLGFDINNFPNAYSRYQNQITLPLYNNLTDSNIEYICDNLLENILKLNELDEKNT